MTGPQITPEQWERLTTVFDAAIAVDTRERPSFIASACAGDDVVLPLTLPFPTLVLGGEVSVPTLDGEPEKVSIPAGTAVGSEIRVKGRGLGRLGRNRRGDMVIRAGVAVPEKPSAREKELLRQYAEEIGAPVGSKTVLDKAKKIFS